MKYDISKAIEAEQIKANLSHRYFSENTLAFHLGENTLAFGDWLVDSVNQFTVSNDPTAPMQITIGTRIVCQNTLRWHATFPAWLEKMTRENLSCMTREF